MRTQPIGSRHRCRRDRPHLPAAGTGPTPSQDLKFPYEDHGHDRIKVLSPVADTQQAPPSAETGRTRFGPLSARTAGDPDQGRRDVPAHPAAADPSFLPSRFVAQ